MNELLPKPAQIETLEVILSECIEFVLDWTPRRPNEYLKERIIIKRLGTRVFIIL